MSEIKGTLLGLVLTIVVFGMVFVALTVATKENMVSIVNRLNDMVESSEPEIAVIRNFSYHF